MNPTIRAAVVLVACALLPGRVALAAQAQPSSLSPEEAAQRTRTIARNFEENARQLTLFDRAGRVLQKIGDRAIYTQPVLSPDKRQIAAIRSDLQAQTSDVWIIDVASGVATRLTSNKPRENAASPVWSPDSRRVAYAALRGSHFGVYRRAIAPGSSEERLYELAGGSINITDWSRDGRFLIYVANDATGNAIYRLPTEPPYQPSLLVKLSSTEATASRVSPDGTLLAYRANENGRYEIWVSDIDASHQSSANPRKWQASTGGALGMSFWRNDGRELYYLAPDRGVMAVDVRTADGVSFGTPRRLFVAPESIPITPITGSLGNISRDGERVLFAVPPAPKLRRLVVFDRTGRVVTRIGEPALYLQPAVSPDGSSVAVIRQNQKDGSSDLWRFDMQSGRGTPITNDPLAEQAPIWSPDGRTVAYVASHANYSGVYRRSADGTGAEEMLFRYTPGAGLALTDVSADGRFLAFTSGGMVAVVPLAGEDPLKRTSVDFARSEFDTAVGRFSPDGQFVAYMSNEVGKRQQVFVQRFDAGTAAAVNDKWQVSHDGTIGGIAWRRDGRELYYLHTDPASDVVHVMAADVETTPSLKTGTPHELFQFGGPLPGNPGQWKNVSPDGTRFVFALPD